MITTDLKIPKDLSDEIVDFALNNGIKYFTVNNATTMGNRRFCNINKINVPLRDRIRDFSQECYSKFDVEVKREHIYGNLIGVNLENAFIHKHMDPKNERGDWHVRLNFLIQKPIAGGNVLIEDKEYDIDEGCSWMNFASEWLHGSTAVVGEKERIVLSLGNYIPEPSAKKLLSLYNIEK